MRVAFHAINGVGLGHLVRAVTIAGQVRRLHPDAAILVLTNAADTSMLVHAGFDFVSFPPGLTEPHADPDRVRRGLPAAIEHSALAAALDAFRPDLVVFDTHGPAALARHAADIGARSVLVQREMRPEILEAFFARGAPAAFDRIVVPHEPGDLDLSALAHFPVVATGPVVRELATKLPRGVRAPRVVMMTGGGGHPVDARKFLRAAADAHILARARIPNLTTLIVAGPYGELPQDLQGIAGLTVVGACAHLPALIAHAALVVSQAGYNSVAELRVLQKPAVLVPAHPRSDDQVARAKRLVAAGAAVIARPNARSIADALESLLPSPQALAAMSAAHRRNAIVPRNRATAEAVLRPLRVGRTVQRVVLIPHDFAPRIGGMETVARALAVGLIAKGIDVRVYAARHFGPEVSDLPTGTVRRLYTPGIALWSDLLITLDALLVDSPDVIHLCNAGLGPWVPALRAAFPAVVTINVHGNDLLAPWVQHGGDPDVYRAAQIAGLRAADEIVAVSAFSRRAAVAAGVPRSRIEVIENGVDCARFSPGSADAALAARLAITPDDEVVLTVSRLVQRKGHAVALHALAELLRERPRALYVYTGENPRLAADLASLASDLGVRDRVRAVGFVDAANLPSLYRLARVFALLSDESPTDVEGFGVSLLEAAATGLPVVATRTGGIPEAVANGLTGILVPPGDPHATARAFATLLADSERARTLGEHGRARVLERFSVEHCVSRVVERWSAVLQTGRSMRPLRHFASGFAGPPSATASPRMTAVRDALRGAQSGVALIRMAQQDAIARRERTSRRRANFARIVGAGGLVRLRALEAGALLLPDALAECAALGHRPSVDMKLRRFVEPEFQTHALPLIRGARLVHSVPTASAAALNDRLALLSAAAFAKIENVRIVLETEARTSPALIAAAVSETRAIRLVLAPRGVTIAVPPEIARHLRARGKRRNRSAPARTSATPQPSSPNRPRRTRAKRQVMKHGTAGVRTTNKAKTRWRR